MAIVAQVALVKKDSAACRIVKTGQETDDCCFADPRWSDNADVLSRVHRERQVGEHVWLTGIRERHLAELQRPDWFCQGHRVGRIRSLHGRDQQLTKTVER